jgi:hypothetical protein
MNEIWKPYPPCQIYEVSNLGRVRRLETTIIRNDGVVTVLPKKLLTIRENHDGYPRVRLKDRQIFVHRMVLEAFVGPKPADKYQGCHNNGIPNDNRVENLRWDTPSNNVRDRIRHNTYQIGEKNHQNKYPDDLIIKLGNSTDCVSEVAQYYNVKRSLVYYARRRKRIKKGVFSPIYEEQNK